MNKPNRAHYYLDSCVLSYPSKGWQFTGKFLCVYHARRLNSCQRVRPIKTSNKGMSRPGSELCSECLISRERCEHDAQHCICPKISGSGCGRDLEDELGGSW